MAKTDASGNDAMERVSQGPKNKLLEIKQSDIIMANRESGSVEKHKRVESYSSHNINKTEPDMDSSMVSKG